MRRLALLGLAACLGCGTATIPDAGAVFVFSDAGYDGYASCLSGFSEACAADVYAAVRAQIDFSTSIFAQSAANGGFLSWEETDAGASQTFAGRSQAQSAAYALRWVDSLLFTESTNSANLVYVERALSYVAQASGKSEDVANDLYGFFQSSNPSVYLGDGGYAGSFLQNDFVSSLTATNVLLGGFNASPIDFQFTPNYSMVDSTRALGVFWLTQSTLWRVYGPSAGNFQFALSDFASQVSQFAARTRSRAATRCTEQPVSPVCATVASYEAKTIAPALDRLAAEVLLAADAGPY